MGNSVDFFHVFGGDFLLLFKVVELLVDMDCQGCETKVRRAISKLSGKEKKY